MQEQSVVAMAALLSAAVVARKIVGSRYPPVLELPIAQTALECGQLGTSAVPWEFADLVSSNARETNGRTDEAECRHSAVDTRRRQLQLAPGRAHRQSLLLWRTVHPAVGQDIVVALLVVQY